MQGVLFALPECAKTPVELVRLWMHEAERVYKDKLVDNTDMETYDKLSKEIIKKAFEVRQLGTYFRLPPFILQQCLTLCGSETP